MLVVCIAVGVEQAGVVLEWDTGVLWGWDTGVVWGWDTGVV